MKTKKRKGLFSLLLMLILVGITIGYAALSTNLNINGTSKVSGNSWDIHFNNVQITSGSVATISPEQAATITANNTTEVTYIVTLQKPGDFYEFTVDAVNAGTIDGMIGTIASKLNGTVIDAEHPLPVYLNYSISYEDGTNIANNHLLASGDTETYKVRLEFKRDIENNQLPSTDQSNSLSFGISYVQRDYSAIVVPHPVTVYTANIIDENDQENTVIKIGYAIPTDITQYSSAAEARAFLADYISAYNVPFSLKHIVADGIVTESYLEFEITPEIANNNIGMTTGTYVLKGGAGSTFYDNYKSILQTAFGVSNCIERTTKYLCSTEEIAAWAYSDGQISVSSSSLYCIIDWDDKSFCDYSDQPGI